MIDTLLECLCPPLTYFYKALPWFRICCSQHVSIKRAYERVYECSGSVVECLTRDQWSANLSLTGITASVLEQGTLILCLVLIQPRKTHPDISETTVDWGVKSQNKQTKGPNDQKKFAFNCITFSYFLNFTTLVNLNPQTSRKG